MRRVMTISILLAAWAAGQWQLSAAKQATMRFVGDINGARADAVVTFEQLRDYVLMSGEIQSKSFKYTFTADIYGDSGFGEIVSHSENTRFRIKIQYITNGFALTSNPLGPGTPSTYYFKKV